MISLRNTVSGWAVAGLLVVTANVALAQKEGKMMPTGGKMGLSATDTKFAKTAAMGGIAEVKFGQLAVKQGSGDAKMFGQHMVDDHSKANDELKQIASTKGLALPTDMPAKMKPEYASLSKLHGAAFNAKYFKLMRDDHKEDIEEFTKEVNSGKDADVKAFAAKTLPIIKGHYAMVQNMGKGKSKMDKMGKM